MLQTQNATTLKYASYLNDLFYKTVFRVTTSRTLCISCQIFTIVVEGEVSIMLEKFAKQKKHHFITQRL